MLIFRLGFPLMSMLSLTGCSGQDNLRLVTVTIPSDLRAPCLVADRDYAGLQGAALLVNELAETNECNVEKIRSLDRILTDHEQRVAAFNADKEAF